MRKKRITWLAVLLAAALVLGLTPSMAAESERAPGYTYQLVCGSDGSGGTIALDLYVRPDAEDDPVLAGGSFGLRCPPWLGTEYTFTPAVTLHPLVPAQRWGSDGPVTGSGYHAFAWESGPETWGGDGLLLGRYEFKLPVDGVYPFKDDIGQKNFLETDESEPVERGGDRAGDPYNRTVYNPDTGLYQGYYPSREAEQAGEGLLTQTDIGFVFTPPALWPAGGLLVTSYAPKKPISLALYDGTGALVADTFGVPVWGESTDGVGRPVDGARLYADPQSPADAGTGTGRYVAVIDLSQCWLGDQPAAIKASQPYTLVISKPGHLPVTLSLLTHSAGLSDAVGLPDSVYLPCGDIAPNGEGGFGDGAVKLNDRAVLVSYLNGLCPDYVPEKAADVDGAGQPLNEGAWLADLDGDGSVTLADLNILMAGENNNQMTENWKESA